MKGYILSGLESRARKNLMTFMVVVMSFTFFNTAQAAVDMFLDVTGVEGESEDDVHKGEMDVLAWSWGASSNGRKSCVQDLGITKWVDLASARLLMGQMNGEVFSELTLTVRKAGDIPLEYIVLKLFNVQVTSLSTGGSGGEDRLTENVSFSFETGTFTYTPQNEKGAPGTSVSSDISPSKC